MKSQLYQKVKQFLVELFTKAGNTNEIKHFERTAYWIQQLKPDADEALLIAAVAHDIERAFREPAYSQKFKKSEKGFRDEEHLSYHQQRGAEIIADFLKSQNADEKLIKRVVMLISKHEVGGNDEQNLLKDADSVSFFENNVEYFISTLVPKVGAHKVKDKFDWMFNKVTSEKAKEIARPWYKDAVEKLG
jgi:hypothetical protein